MNPSQSDIHATISAGEHRIAAVREECGLTRSQLARRSGVSRRRLAAYENGTAEPSPGELAAVAAACGVGADQIAAPAPAPAVVAGIVISGSAERLRGPVASDALLRAYLSMLLELRRTSEIPAASLREADIAELATAIGRTPEAVKARLVELPENDERDTTAALAFLTS
jgi:transcriptional regulator with XRE-family HTH domain